MAVPRLHRDKAAHPHTDSQRVSGGSRVLTKNMVPAIEFWTPPFHFSTNASANLLVLVAKLSVTPQLGLQRHLASKVAPKAPQGLPKGPQKVSRQPP